MELAAKPLLSGSRGGAICPRRQHFWCLRRKPAVRRRAFRLSLVLLPAGNSVDLESGNTDVLQLMIAVSAKLKSCLAIALMGANSR
jgi:hypothetical protein